MNRAVPLSQFMPYGAPDLIAAGRTHMSRAVMTSSLLAVAAFLLAVVLVPLVPKAVEKAVPVPPEHRIYPDILPPPDIPPIVEPAGPPRIPEQGMIEPVSERAIPAELPTELPRATVMPGTAEGVGPPVVAPAPCLCTEAIPPRGTFIYTDELPVPVLEAKPEYPSLPKEAGVEGLVVVHVYVGLDGRVMKAEVDPRHSVPMLDGAAKEAALKWVFKPALTNNHPVAVWVRLPFRFSLH